MNEVDTLAKECYKMMQTMYKSEYSEILNIFYGISVTQIKSYDKVKILVEHVSHFLYYLFHLPNKKLLIFLNV